MRHQFSYIFAIAACGFFSTLLSSPKGETKQLLPASNWAASATGEPLNKSSSKSNQGDAGEYKVAADDGWTDGRDLVLQGHVKIEHEGSLLEAQEARLKRTREGGESPQEIELHKEIRLQFRDGSFIYCDNASVDCSKQGVIHWIQAQGNIKTSYKNNLKTTSEKAFYLHDVHQQPPHRLLQATKLNWWNLFDSERVTAAAAVHMPQLPHLEEQRAYDLLVLRENVQLEHPELGTLVSDEDVQVLQLKHGESLIPERIVSTGTTAITIHSRKTQEHCSLICHGKVIFDNTAKRLFLHSFHQEGEIERDRQVCYQDQLGAVKADAMVIDLVIENEHYVPTKVLLTGNVCMINHNETNQQEAPFKIQYALADWVEYSPQEDVMLLSAEEGHRVLFLDKTQDSKISAMRVIFHRKEQKIEGVGGVRFSLSDMELNRFKDVFGI